MDGFKRVEGAFSALLNAIDDAKADGQTTELGVEYLDSLENKVEALLRDFDRELRYEATAARDSR